MINFNLVEETFGYVTAEDPTNTDRRFLVGGSQNVLIDRNRKITSRKGYSRLGAANENLTPIRNAWTWNNSTGGELSQRFYDDELEVYLGTVDGDTVNAWTRVEDSWSTTEIMRHTIFWDDSENLDIQVMVIGDDNLYSWGGGVASAASATVNTITKAGTTTFAQNRFFVNGNLNLVNTRTGTIFAYTGGTGTTTLTGVTPDPSADIQSGDILVQQVVTNADTPEANRNNHTIGIFENQVVVGSEDANEVFLSKNDDYTDFTQSSPRVAGDGAFLTLDGPSKGFGSLGKRFIAFAGEDSIFTAQYENITVSTTLAEAFNVKKIANGEKQGSFGPDTLIQLGNAIIFLSNEPALRIIEDPGELEGLDPRTLSNPIKPDFDAEDFTNAHSRWVKNAVHLSSPANSKLYILEFVEDADGRVRRFWDPPQILPVRAMSIRDGDLHIHSNAIPETYKLFDGFSDINSSDEKLPINHIAKSVYRTYGRRANLKEFDRYFVEGEISASTDDLLLKLNYDFNGVTQLIERTIDGSDEDILQGLLISASLAQQSLAQGPLAGSLTAPADARKFRVNFEIAKEDFHEIQAVFETNEVDRFWSILGHGANVKLSKRRDTVIMK